MLVHGGFAQGVLGPHRNVLRAVSITGPISDWACEVCQFLWEQPRADRLCSVCNWMQVVPSPPSKRKKDDAKPEQDHVLMEFP